MKTQKYMSEWDVMKIPKTVMMHMSENGEFISVWRMRMLNVLVLALMNVYILNYKDANV